MPDGWLEHGPKRVPDPSAHRPEDWDDEEDGEWETPMVDNPDCKVGCGKWHPPTISNPDYKGKWHAPRTAGSSSSFESAVPGASMSSVADKRRSLRIQNTLWRERGRVAFFDALPYGRSLPVGAYRLACTTMRFFHVAGSVVPGSITIPSARFLCRL